MSTLRIYCSSDGSNRRVITDRSPPRWVGAGFSLCDPVHAGSWNAGIKKAIDEQTKYSLTFDPKSEAARIEHAKQIILGNLK